MCGENQLVRCVQIWRDGWPGWVEPITSEGPFLETMIEELREEVRNLLDGDEISYEFKIVTMTQAQLEAAPAFEGW